MTGETEKRILRPFSIEDIPWEPRGEHFGGRVKTLANSDRDNLHLGVHIEELPPGKQSSPFHYHLHGPRARGSAAPSGLSMTEDPLGIGAELWCSDARESWLVRGSGGSCASGSDRR